VKIKGNSRRSIKFWVRHLLNTKDNDRAEIIGSRGLVAEDLRGMLEEIKQDASISDRCRNFMHIASFNPQAHEHLTQEQWEQAYEIYEKHRGIPPDMQRIEIEHHKKGRTHRHVVWQRVNPETGRAFEDGLNFRVCEAAQKEIEETLGLEKTRHLLNREPGEPRPERGPKYWERMRGQRSGIKPEDVTAEITEIFRQSENGADLVNGLREHGYQFVEGNRAFCVLDPAGDVHSLAKRIEGIKTKDLKAFMQGVDLSNIPTVEQGQALIWERNLRNLEAEHDAIKREIDRQKAPAAIEQQPKPWDRDGANQAWENAVTLDAQQVPSVAATRRMIEETLPYKQRQGEQVSYAETLILDARRAAMLDERAKEGDPIPNARAFADALEQKGIAFAVTTPDESYKSHRDQAFARAVGRKSDYFEPGEIVVVTEPRLERVRAGEWTAPPRVHKLDQAQAEQYLTFLSLDKSKLKGIEATKAVLDASAEERAAYWRDIRLERATDIYDRAPARAGKGADIPAAIRKAPARVIGGAFNIGVELAGLFFSFIDAPKSPRQQARDNLEGERLTARRNAEAEVKIDFTKYTGERAQDQRNEQQEEAARDRERGR